MMTQLMQLQVPLRFVLYDFIKTSLTLIVLYFKGPYSNNFYTSIFLKLYLFDVSKMYLFKKFVLQWLMTDS